MVTPGIPPGDFSRNSSWALLQKILLTNSPELLQESLLRIPLGMLAVPTCRFIYEFLLVFFLDIRSIEFPGRFTEGTSERFQLSTFDGLPERSLGELMKNSWKITKKNCT